MRRALGVSLVVVALAASVLVAHASSLTVNAGYLQVLTVDAPEFQPPPDPDTYTISVYLFFYNDSNSPSGHNDTLELSVSRGGSYTLSWTGQSLDSSTCPSNPPTPPMSPMGHGLGTFTPQASGDHILCLDGEKNWNNNTASPDFVEVETSSAETGSASSGPESRSASQELSDGDPAKATTSGSETEAGDEVSRPDGVPDFVGENCQDGGWQELLDGEGEPYADEQACVDDQVRVYYEQQGEGE